MIHKYYELGIVDYFINENQHILFNAILNNDIAKIKAYFRAIKEM